MFSFLGISNLRTINANTAINAVANAAIEINYQLGADVISALERAIKIETSATGLEVLEQILQNAKVARAGQFPLCQDTGLAIAFVQMGEDVRVEGGLRAAVTDGIRQGYSEGYLRKAICDPFTRENTGDNTPAVIHIEVIPGDALVIDLIAKGGGAENMSRAASLPPSAGEKGVIEYAVETVRVGGVNACPPLVIGVGVGGDLELAAHMAKRALARRVGEPSVEPHIAALERKILAEVNRLGIGPGGLGGKVTALAVRAIAAPCHIASLPVAVVLECHSHRHRRIVL